MIRLTIPTQKCHQFHPYYVLIQHPILSLIELNIQVREAFSEHQLGLVFILFYLLKISWYLNLVDLDKVALRVIFLSFTITQKFFLSNKILVAIESTDLQESELSAT